MFAHTSDGAAAPAATRDVVGLTLRPLSAFPDPDAGATGSDVEPRIADWIRSFLMRPNPDLGRAGAVCPYTPVSAKIGLARIGSSTARDEHAIFAVMREAVAAFEAIECASAHRQYRTVLIAFPNCVGDGGRETLKRVQNRLRSESTRRGKMIGLFEPNAPDKGLINPDFRPMRSPAPLLAIRELVDNDAPFVLRNPRIAPIYLIKFPLTGPRKLLSALWR